MASDVFGVFRRHKPAEVAPTVKDAIERRDALFDTLDVAIAEVDDVTHRLLDDYRRAEQQRARRA